MTADDGSGELTGTFDATTELLKARHSCHFLLRGVTVDAGRRALLERLVINEEEHLDLIDTEMSMIADIGIGLYTQHQIG